ncbi:hypothetical protein CPB83DRAFT_816785 [Crepidotus variabilis]|uniref:BTB domain-containing protein n=1 Tax=Crepidotus variabilis TaxID=179855 RepID=A0A9P6EC07_9AGAR|nr:hypothetical protein CPB83DRAFT_816785 [Crepidotus variabilis]
MADQWISRAVATFLSDIEDLQNEHYTMNAMNLEHFQHPDQQPVVFEDLYAQAISPDEEKPEAELHYQFKNATKLSQIFNSVSPFFHLDSHPRVPQADILFCSQDRVLFYLHSSVILQTSEFAFEKIIGGSLNDPKFRGALIPVDVASPELNVVLLLLYGSSPVNYFPTLECLSRAVDLMPDLSLSPEDLMLPGSFLYVLLLSIAPSYPIEVYITAAHHHLHDLAVITSSYLLSYPIHAITDSQALRMGAVYLRKFLALRVTRATALKNILGYAPFPHAPVKRCGFEEQKKLTSVWAFATSYVVWDSKSGTR